MKVKLFILTKLLFLAIDLPTMAQTLNMQVQREIDSLQLEVRNTNFDSAKVRLRYKIGVKKSITRTGYWDTIYNQAIISNYVIYQIRALNIAGGWLTKKDTGDKALEYLNRAVEIANKFNKKSEVVFPIFNLAGYYLQHNYTDMAIKYCLQGLQISEEIKNKKHQNRFHALLGDLYLQQGDINRALKMQLQFVRVSKELKLNDEIATGLIGLGGIYRELENKELAKFYYLQSANYINGLKDSILIAAVYDAIGDAHEMQLDYDSARFFFNKALQISERNHFTEKKIGTLTLLAQNALNLKDTKTAARIGNEALLLAKKMSLAYLIPSIASVLTRIHLKSGNYEEAFKANELYQRGKDSVSNEKNRKKLLQKEFDYKLEKKESENKLLAEQNQNQALRLSLNAVVIISLMGVLLAVFVFANSFRKQSKMREQEHKIEFTQRLLRSQVNPHFMSNSLSAVQNLIYTEQTDKAVEYLAKFSAFLRQTLDSSEKHHLSLAEEIKTLKLYLQLEQLRFKNDFNVNLRIASGLELSEILVPSFVTQPFIENAIWHGLLPLKERVPQLNIDVYQQGNLLYFVIEDNGIGRKDMVGGTKKNSKGTRLVTESIKNLNDLTKSNDNKIEIIDLFDENRHPCGTKVIIQLIVYKLDE